MLALKVLCWLFLQGGIASGNIHYPKGCIWVELGPVTCSCLIRLADKARSTSFLQFNQIFRCATSSGDMLPDPATGEKANDRCVLCFARLSNNRRSSIGAS